MLLYCYLFRMISIILKCDKSWEELNLTEEYWATSLKQVYYMLVNWEIDWREVKKEDWEFKHYKKVLSNK